MRQIFKGKSEKCVSEAKHETDYQRKKAKNVCQRPYLRQIIMGKSQKCVSEAKHETDYQRKKRKN